MHLTTDLSMLRRATVAILTGVTLTTLLAYMLLTEGLTDLRATYLAICGVFFGTFALVLLLTSVVPWYTTSGRISVSIDAEQFMVTRRQSLLFACRPDEIVKVAVRGVASWSSLNPQQATAGGRFPRLKVWTRTGDWESPGLLLWQEEAEMFERSIRHALSGNR